MTLRPAPALAALGLLAATAAASAQAPPEPRGCGAVVVGGERFPVQVTEGDPGCDTARATIREYLGDLEKVEGWACVLGRYGDPFGARCSQEPDGAATVEALNSPRVVAPERARRGRRVEAVASGLERGRYTLTLVADDAPARGARCLARVGRARRTTGGWVTIRGRIPRKLRCYQGLNSFLGSVRTTPGAYHLVIGVKIAPAGWDAEKTFLRSALRVR